MGTRAPNDHGLDVQPLKRGEHLDLLLAQAHSALYAGNPRLAVTHLAQAVYVAVEKDGPVDELEVYRKVRDVINAGGGLA